MRRLLAVVTIALLVIAPAPEAMALPLTTRDGFAASGVDAGSGDAAEYVVLYREGVSASMAQAAVRRAGGTIVKENAKVGVATVSATASTFAASAARQTALVGVARNRAVGRNIDARRLQQNLTLRREVERLSAERAASKGVRQAGTPATTALAAEPLAALQWDMQMIHATVDGSYAVQPGDKRVLVGIIDTGIDGAHPDIAPNFDKALSRNFTTDIPELDGPCEHAGCVDPVDEDDDGHGTHVAGTVAAPLNGLGIAGVAPNVTLVNIRAGQDSGYFFLQPTVDALVYAADAGINVVNMSFFTDPWLYNCQSHPADSAEERLAQRTALAAIDRALHYASLHRVTLIAAAGNEHTDLGNPTIDEISPDYPPDAAKTRTVNNSCRIMPAEGHQVLAVSAVGPSKMKADYSNYGAERIVVAAPGGYFRDYLGTPQHRQVTNLILAPYPKHLAIANDELEPDGTPNTPFVVRDCQNGVCAYYQYLQGTSMAAPHATGVVALLASQYGQPQGNRLSLGSAATKWMLKYTATPTACPAPVLDYTAVGRPASYAARCTGSVNFNSIYGDGIIDALRAVTFQKQWNR